MDSQDTNNDAVDFNVGSPSPFENNNETVNGGAGVIAGRDRGGQLGTSSVEGTALGSTVRINQVYVFSPGADNIEFYNPTSDLVDMAGWFFQGAFIEPIYDSGGSEPVPSLDRTTLPQGYSSTFSFEIGYDDVIYLYRPDMVRVDQLGWTQTPFFFPDLCLIRTTDGVGPAECHDFNSCGGLTGTILYESCGLQSVTVGVEGGSFTTALAAPFPNPATDRGTISFVVGGTEGVPSAVSLAVYDVAGRKLRTLARGPLAAGAYSISWDGRSDGGSAVGSGVYFVRLRVGSEPVQTRSVVWATR